MNVDKFMWYISYYIMRYGLLEMIRDKRVKRGLGHFD